MEKVAAEQRFSLMTLTALVVGSMVGAGIFALPTTFGNATGPFGAIVAWIIAGTGMLMLAFVFQNLAVRKPDIDAGIFGYAQAGFGNYPGFVAGFGFWASTCLGNVTYFVLIMSTVHGLFPTLNLAGGNTIPAIIASSVILWSVHFMILRGIKEAAFINKVVTFAKIIPIFVFIVILIFAFQKDLFVGSFWGGTDQVYTWRDIFDQVRSTMLVTVFVFIGIEGASIYSRYAKKREDVGVATVLGFIGVLLLLVMVTLLPYGVLMRPELAALGQPSMAAVLEAIVGPWGAWFISIGLIISVMGAFLAWTLFAAEILFATSKGNLVPKLFSHENDKKVPSTALWASNLLVQFLLIVLVFSQYAFQLSLELTSAMMLIPYALVAAYALKLTITRETYGTDDGTRRKEMTWAAIATLYALFMIWAGGLDKVLLSAILFAPGTLLFIFSRREQRLKTFTGVEMGLFALILAGAGVGIFALATGQISI